MIILQVLFAIIPAIVLCLIVYDKDKVEKEPYKLLRKLFLIGIATALLSYLIIYLLKRYIPTLNVDVISLNYFNLFLYTILGVALIEEGLKFLSLYLVGWKNKEFNYKYDIIVYSVFIGLGFATIENLIYALNNNDIILTLLRGLLSVPGHAFFGIWMGYYLMMAKNNKINGVKAAKYKLLGILVPILMHTGYNYLLFLNIKTGSSTVMAIFGAYVLFLYLLSFKVLNKASKEDRKLGTGSYFMKR